MSERAGRERTWAPGRPVDVLSTLWPLRHGLGDPAHQVTPDGTFWWGCATPQGPGTLALRSTGAAAYAAAWGQGASWLLDVVPRLLGADDDWSTLHVTGYPVLHETLRRCPGMRLPSTGLVLDSLVPAILEQRVTGLESRRAWRGLLYRFGSPAPGPLARLRIPPPAGVLLEMTTWEWHRLGVDLRRQLAIRAAATVAYRLEECTRLALDAAVARLRLVPGVGEWTAAETAQRAFGHPDAVSVGDYHIPDLVGYALTGVPRTDDAQMLQLLAPWRGQRQRVVRLVEASGIRKPRFAPRLATTDIRAI
jgi:3-methyladenine DNA glycosylase/8-oxoguanine DNA glycosylase